MQLVAYGAQDLILTGTPQITFFKLVHRRHTNFAIQSIEQVFNGTAGFGRKVTCTIARTGDLVGSMFLQVDLPHLQNWRDQLSMPVMSSAASFRFVTDRASASTSSGNSTSFTRSSSTSSVR
jgi:hypothetical protein